MSVEQERIEFLSKTMKYLIKTPFINSCYIQDINYITFSNESMCRVHMILADNLLMTVNGNRTICDVFKRMYNKSER